MTPKPEPETADLKAAGEILFLLHTALPQDKLPKLVEHLQHIMLASEKRGMVEGITMFAWWKDGAQYVGTCGTTLKQAIAEINGAAITQLPEREWK